MLAGKGSTLGKRSKNKATVPKSSTVLPKLVIALINRKADDTIKEITDSNRYEQAPQKDV